MEGLEDKVTMPQEKKNKKDEKERKLEKVEEKDKEIRGAA